MAHRKRNLTLDLGFTNSPFSPVMPDSNQSPMTNLSNIMTTLTCAGNTPKRKLSLTDLGVTPTPPIAKTSFSRNSSQSSDAGVSFTLDPSSPCRLEDVEQSSPKSSLPKPMGRAKERRKVKCALRRLNSMPAALGSLSSGFSLLASSSAKDDSSISKFLESPDEDEELKFLSENLLTNQRQDSSSVSIPTSVLPVNNVTQSEDINIDESNQRHRPISAPASLLNQGHVQITVTEDEPVVLQHCRLTSTDDDDDDGFCDIFDSDSQGSTENVSEGLAGLFNAPIIKTREQDDHTIIKSSFQSPSFPLQEIDCNTMECTPEPKCRRGIFKVPSQPAIRRNSCFLKRPERPRDTPSPIQKKKQRSASISSPSNCQKALHKKSTKPPLMRSFSEVDFKKIDVSLCSDVAFSDLIGDRSKAFILPVIQGKHRDLKSITPETLAAVIKKKYEGTVEEYFIVDSRYPYEFNGGHIMGAVNLYKQDQISEFFMDHPMQSIIGRRIIIFHCEFSSKRGPDLLKFLRNEDRNSNLQNYPALHYPELYILEGGYKGFFETHKELCEPQRYTPMLHQDHGADLRHFKAKSKSWQGEQRSRLNLRCRAILDK